LSTIDPLNTNNVSWIAYYDVTEHTSLTSISTDNMHKADGVTVNKPYDDGVELKYSGIPTRSSAVIRASTAGWITAHMDRKSQYSDSPAADSGGINGIHDIINWTNSSESNIENNLLERGIYKCIQQVGNSEINNNYNSSDVGLYNYKHGSGNVSLFVETGTSKSSFSFTSATNVKKAIITSSSVGFGGSSARFKINGNTIYSGPGGGRADFHTAEDITSQLDNGQSVSTSLDSGYGRGQKVTVTVIWE
jgi:hypothetical protein